MTRGAIRLYCASDEVCTCCLNLYVSKRITGKESLSREVT